MENVNFLTHYSLPITHYSTSARSLIPHSSLFFYGAKALPLKRLPMVLAVIFICTKGLAGTTVLYK